MIYVIGSGHAGISAVVTLVEAGLALILLDGGLTLEPEREQAIRRLEQQLPEQWDPAVIASFHEPVVSDAQGVQIKYLYGSDFPYQGSGLRSWRRPPPSASARRINTSRSKGQGVQGLRI